MASKRQKEKKELDPKQQEAMRRQLRLMLLLFLPIWILSFLMVQRNQKTLQEEQARKRAAATAPVASQPETSSPDLRIKELEAAIQAQPKGPEAEKAFLTIAQIRVEEGEWLLAAGQYEEFGKRYARSPWAAHAKFTAGVIYAEHLGDVQKMEKLLKGLTFDTKDTVWVQTPSGEWVPRLAALAAMDRLDPVYQDKWQYRMLDALVGIFNPRENPQWAYALGIILLAVLVKLLTAPLTSWTFKSMRVMQEKMRVIQPLLQDLQRRYKDDQMRMLREQQKLFKEHNIRMGSGCLPMIVQMAILIPMYGAIKVYGHQFAQGSFLWVANLALPDWPLLIIYTVSMYASMRLMPTPPSADKSQAQMQKWMNLLMPAILLVVMRNIPSAFILYWAAFNVLSTAQQFGLYRRWQSPAPATVAAGPVAVNPSGPKPARIKRPKAIAPATEQPSEGDGKVSDPARGEPAFDGQSPASPAHGGSPPGK